MGAQLGFDTAALRGAWGPDLTLRSTAAWPVMARQRPAEVAVFLTEAAARPAPSSS